MMKVHNEPQITRRQALQGAAALVGGSIAVTQLGPFMSRAAMAATEGAEPVFLDSDQFALVERVIDLMIPETDTPGAHATGVHYFVDLMLEEWASTERQSRYISGLREMNDRLNEIGGADFVASSEADQLNALQVLDAAAFAANSEDVFYPEFKKLALFGYYSSEAGATAELQYELLTPEYKACVPIDEIGRTWFWANFRHGL